MLHPHLSSRLTASGTRIRPRRLAGRGPSPEPTDVRAPDAKRRPRFRGAFLSGAPRGIRTPNLLIRSQMLYPLSHGRIALRRLTMLVHGCHLIQAELSATTGCAAVRVAHRPGNRGPRQASSWATKSGPPPRMTDRKKLAEVAGFEPAMGFVSQTRLAGGRHRPTRRHLQRHERLSAGRAQSKARAKLHVAMCLTHVRTA